MVRAGFFTSHYPGASRSHRQREQGLARCHERTESHSEGLNSYVKLRTVLADMFGVSGQQILFLMPRERRSKYTRGVESDALTSPAPYAELLRKVFDLAGRGLSKPLAETILAVDFPESDASRAAELNEKANEGLLTDAERDEPQVYANVADLLAYTGAGWCDSTKTR